MEHGRRNVARSGGVTRLLVLVLGIAWAGVALAQVDAGDAPELMRQTTEEAAAKSAGCLSCHDGIEPMHSAKTVKLGCTDCHGGNAEAGRDGAEPGSSAYDAARSLAHVAPSLPEEWADPDDPDRISSANPEQPYTLTLRESYEYVRFVNPGDLRVADESCGSCHVAEVNKVKKSLMTTSAMLWGGAAYNNGILPNKRYILGESYGPDGKPQRINAVRPLNEEEKARGLMDVLLPLPPWNIVQPPDPLRAFERGGFIERSIVSEIANPNIGLLPDEPGRPDNKLGTRGLGTDTRVSAGVLNIHKTRLNDPHLSLMGTNDHPGDYRSSGCTACHVVYANDRDEVNSAFFARFGHDGQYHGSDPTLPRDESGHPVVHRLTRAIPSSQCIVCHMHQPNSFVNTYLGYQMWDYETDGELMWPEEQRFATSLEPFPFHERDSASMKASLIHNPEAAAVRGKWTDKEFLKGVSELPTEETKFADYHGHGWVFRSVFWQDRKGMLLDRQGDAIAWEDPGKLDKAVHLKDIHLEKGMHCVDCHFEQDVHGDGNIHGEYPSAVEIRCANCHGSVTARAGLRTTGPAAPEGGHDLLEGITPFGDPRFEWEGDTLLQRSMLDPDLEWKVSQVVDTLNPAHPDYNEKARYAKTVRKDGRSWGSVPGDLGELAHQDEELACFACHTSWVTSCFGCHLPQEANWLKDSNHFEGDTTRNWSSYNPQVLRHDIFMLGKHSVAKDGIIGPVRSSSALMISTTNLNRERLYYQQMPVSAPGFSSQAFNVHFPHTVRGEATRTCDDCHVSKDDDNNAWLAQVYTLGTNFVNFMGRFAWVGMGEDGIAAVGVSEWDEPQAVIGSRLHRLAYPDEYQDHIDHGTVLEEAYSHGAENIRSLQLRGEYLYTANGSDGLRVFDVANVDNKGFSERIITAPVSPLGQRAYARTEDATYVALPTNMSIHFDRERPPENLEQDMHPIYRYAFVTDSVEGLVVVDVDMLGDGDPQNNFLERVADYNPDGLLDGAHYITLAGHYAYILANAGLVVLNLDDPLAPSIAATIGVDQLPDAQAVAVQFRYAFVTTADGLEVVDITTPERARVVGGLAMQGARDLYVARTYAYVAAGPAGLAIVDVTRPASPTLTMMFDADGQLNDTHSVRLGSTSASTFAYVADGKNGLRVVQLISPGETPGAAGFSPVPTPRLIASYPTPGPAITLSKGLDRDRAVDETGHQVSVFGRMGQRPFTRAEMEELFLEDGELFQVSNEPSGAPLTYTAPAPRPEERRPAPTVRPRTRPDAAPSTPTPEGEPEVAPPPVAPPRLLPGRS